MALHIDFYIEGEHEKGPIDLEASLANLREHLAREPGAENPGDTPVVLAVHRGSDGFRPDWDPNDELSRVWQSDRWIVLADTAEAPPAQEASAEAPDSPRRQAAAIRRLQEP